MFCCAERQPAFELIAFLDCRLGNSLVLGEIEHQDDDNGDCRHEGRRESDQAGPLVVVGVQAAVGQTFIGRRRRVGVHLRRGIDGPPGRGRLLGCGALPCRGFARRGGMEVAVRATRSTGCPGRLGAIRALGARLAGVAGGPSV